MLLDKYMSMDIGRINEQELKSLRNKNSLSALYDMFNGKTIEVEPVYKGYLFQCKGNLFIDNLPKPTSSEDEKYYRLLAKIIKDREFGYPFTTFNWLVVYTHDDPKDFDKYFLEPFELISLGTTEPREEDQPKVGETIKLKLVEEGSMVYWGGNPLPTIKGTDFDILLKLAEKPKAVIIHADLYSLINSTDHEDELLRQRITHIRKAFPFPYSDKNHSQAIIKTKRMEGYGLNLAKEQVEISSKML